MEMHPERLETFFVPEYPLKHTLGFWGMAAMIPAFFLIGLVEGPSFQTAGAIVFFASILLMSKYGEITDIRLGKEITVSFPIRPDLRFRYDEIVDIGLFGISTRKGNFSLFQCENAAEFHRLLREQEKLDPSRKVVIAGRSVGRDAETITGAWEAFFLGAIATLVLLWFNPDILPAAGKHRFAVIFFSFSFLFGLVLPYLHRQNSSAKAKGD